jgi:hypothetical protein
LAARDIIRCAANFVTRVDQLVVEPLMIALCVIMGQESNYGSTQRPLPKKDQAMEALVLQGAHKTFDVGR